MTETITLQLTRAEAEALHALVDNSAERLFGDRNEAKKYALEHWSMETAARACDKLRLALFGEEHCAGSTWSEHLQQLNI